MEENEYPYDQIVRISKKIEKMSDKKHKNDLKKIKKIIEDNNPELTFIQNNNGYFAPDFENLSYNTYVELTVFLKQLEEENSNKETKSNSISNIILSQETTCEKEKEKNKNIKKEKRLKYTNSENLILNKMKYNGILKDHQSENYEIKKEEDKEKEKEHMNINDFMDIIKEESDTNKKLCNKIFRKKANKKN